MGCRTYLNKNVLSNKCMGGFESQYKVSSCLSHDIHMDNLQRTLSVYKNLGPIRGFCPSWNVMLKEEDYV